MNSTQETAVRIGNGQFSNVDSLVRKQTPVKKLHAFFQKSDLYAKQKKIILKRAT